MTVSKVTAQPPEDPMDIAEIVDNFEFLEPGEERYRFILELGKGLPGLDEIHKVETNRVHGCLSRVWMTADLDGGTLRLHADSDAFIVRGLIAIVLALFDGKTPAQILATDPEATFAQLGLGNELSMGRRNGLSSMVQRVQTLAKLHGGNNP